MFGFSAIIAQSNSPIKQDSLISSFEVHLDSSISNGGGAGLAIAIVKEKDIIFRKAYGYRSLQDSTLIDFETSFRIASLSKGFAGILAGMLTKDSLFNLNDKVAKYLPNLRLKDSSSTAELNIRHLLSHTTGVVPHAYDNLIEHNIPFDRILPQLEKAKIICAPGECYGYQNVLFSLIANIVDTAAGKSYQQLLYEKIIYPLGMINVSVDKDEFFATDNYALPHVSVDSVWTEVKMRDTYYSMTPASGINASLNDMIKWTFALLGNQPKVIDPKVLEEVFTPIIETPYERRRFDWNGKLTRTSYGLGWRIFEYSGKKMIYHSGGLRGYRSKIALIPEEKLGIVILQNSSFEQDFIHEFLDLYLENQE